MIDDEWLREYVRDRRYDEMIAVFDYEVELGRARELYRQLDRLSKEPVLHAAQFAGTKKILEWLIAKKAELREKRGL